MGGLLIGFWPLVLSGGWFSGLLQTDTYEYGAMAMLFAERSIAAAGLHFGFGLRYTDMIPAAALADWFGGPGMKIFPVLALAWSSGFAFVGAMVARRLGASSWAVTLAGLAAAYAGSVHGLFVEGYFTRFFFTCLIIYLTLAAAIALDQPRAEWVVGAAPFWPRFGHWLPFIALGAFALALVPYYSLFMPTAALAILARERFSLARAIPLAVAVCVAMALFANVNLWFLAYPEVAFTYSQGADALARFTVFPFFLDARFPAMALGLTPKHWDATIANALAMELGVGAGSMRLYQKLFSVLNSGVTLAIVAAAALLPLVWTWLRGSIRSIEARQVFLASLFAIMALLVAVLAGMGKHLYANLNLAWTSGALLAFAGLPMVLAALSSLMASAGRPAKVLAGPVVLVVLAFIVANALTRLFATSGWYAHPDGAAMQGHVRIAPDIIAVERMLAGASARALRSISISGRNDEFTRTDSDRVLLNALAEIAQARGIACANCSYGGSSYSIVAARPLQHCEAAKDSVTLVIGTATEVCASAPRTPITQRLSIQR